MGIVDQILAGWNGVLMDAGYWLHMRLHPNLYVDADEFWQYLGEWLYPRPEHVAPWEKN